MRLLTVFGTRPEAIKMAPLIKAIEQCPEFESRVCVTGQHREMLDVALKQFNIKPDADLGIMSPEQTLTDITSRTLMGMGEVFEKMEPDMVLVHGDTATTLAGSLAAFYAKIPVGHVEAGLRTFNRYSPFPEEMNRRIVSDICTMHFCPTKLNAENLKEEGIVNDVYVTGNTGIDALSMTVRDDYVFETKYLNRVNFTKKIILATIHRRENYSDLESILGSFIDILNEIRDAELILPVHLSPFVREKVRDILRDAERVHLTAPLPVLDMHNLMARSTLVMTDSGGLQEEAPSLGKPVLVLRRETERPEAIEAGTVKLSGVERADIAADAIELLSNKKAYVKMAKAVNPYGDGKASERIVNTILGKMYL